MKKSGYKLKSFKKDLKSELKRSKGFEHAYHEEMAKLRVAQKLIEIREKLRLTQNDIAKKMGVSQQLVSRVESGSENMTLETLVKFVEALGFAVKIQFFHAKKKKEVVKVA
jgi:predicted transcriptional regulator